MREGGLEEGGLEEGPQKNNARAAHFAGGDDWMVGSAGSAPISLINIIRRPVTCVS